MNTETMTIHRALAELKVLDDRISKAINETSFVVSNKHSNEKIRGLSIRKGCSVLSERLGLNASGALPDNPWTDLLVQKIAQNALTVGVLSMASREGASIGKRKIVVKA